MIIRMKNNLIAKNKSLLRSFLLIRNPPSKIKKNIKINTAIKKGKNKILYRTKSKLFKIIKRAIIINFKLQKKINIRIKIKIKLLTGMKVKIRKK